MTNLSDEDETMSGCSVYLGKRKSSNLVCINAEFGYSAADLCAPRNIASSTYISVLAGVVFCEKIYAQTHRLKYWGRIIMINNSLLLLKATKCRKKMSQFSDTIHFGFFRSLQFRVLEYKVVNEDWFDIWMNIPWGQRCARFSVFFFAFLLPEKTWKTKFRAEHSCHIVGIPVRSNSSAAY